MDAVRQLRSTLAVRDQLNSYNGDPFPFTPPDKATAVARTERLALLLQLLLCITSHQCHPDTRAAVLLRPFVLYILLCAAEVRFAPFFSFPMF
jgi:hypothetical protein